MKYIGLTIGPIIKTLNMAKKTRETWSASYLFSFLMKNLVEQLPANGIAKNNILVPNAGSLIDTGNKYQAGLFPDRLIFQAMEGDFEKLKNAVNATMQIMAAGISEKIGAPLKDVRTDLDNYLQIYFIEKELAPGENPISKLTPHLEAIERHTKYIHHDSNQFLAKFLKQREKDFLSRDAGLKRFPSLIEIATRELRMVNEKAYDEIIRNYIFNDEKDEDETSIIQALKDNELLKKEFKIYHKYIAIVQADGDNIKNTIENGHNPEALKTFSHDLTQYALTAVNLIKEYGGTPVYAGGDDLLFFAPVVNRVKDQNGHIYSKNIFDLIDNLDANFKLKFKEATLSYGISITYYKYPMNEALDQARSLLFEKAKKYQNKDGTEEKNAVAFKVLKHSGRSFETIFYKDLMEQKTDPTPEEKKLHIEKRNIYTLFKDLLSDYGATKKYLNSIVQSLHTHRGIFKELFKNVKDEAVERVKHFFANSFNEPVHDDHRQYINDAAELVYKIYNTAPSTWNDERDEEGDDEQKFQAVYAVLRTLHFFNQDDNERQ